ncbi:MAG: Na+/H+ antiporter subunit E [Gemmatimonas sp.]
MSLVARFVPEPLLSLGLLILWFALARSVSAGQILVGAVLALVVPQLTRSLRPTQARVRRPLVLARYLFVVVWDLMVANFTMAMRVVFYRARPARSRFITIPLDLQDTHGLAALAIVTTIVPGTVWSEIALDRSAVLLHAWDVTDESQFIGHYKARYERPLREIFE